MDKLIALVAAAVAVRAFRRREELESDAAKVSPPGAGTAASVRQALNRRTGADRLDAAEDATPDAPPEISADEPPDTGDPLVPEGHDASPGVGSQASHSRPVGDHDQKTTTR